MVEKKYQLIFSGQLVKTFKNEEVKKNIQTRFKISDTHISIMFSGQPVVIQKDLNYQTALKYCATLKDMGLLCKVQEMEPFKKPKPKTSELRPLRFNSCRVLQKGIPAGVTPCERRFRLADFLFCRWPWHSKQPAGFPRSPLLEFYLPEFRV